MSSLSTSLPESAAPVSLPGSFTASTLHYNPPQFQCLLKAALPDGLTFREWIRDPRNVYISSNLAKYSGNCEATDDWDNGELSYLYKYAIIPHHEYLRLYELWIRRERWSALESISGKTLGCWCTHPAICVFSVIARVYREKMFLKSKLSDSVEKVSEGFDTVN